jgi:hypothetical protein
MTHERTIKIQGQKYRLYSVSYAATIYLAGPGLTTKVPLPQGVGIWSDNIREAIVKAVAVQKECSRKACEYIASTMEAKL